METAVRKRFRDSALREPSRALSPAPSLHRKRPGKSPGRSGSRWRGEGLPGFRKAPAPRRRRGSPPPPSSATPGPRRKAATPRRWRGHGSPTAPGCMDATWRFPRRSSLEPRQGKRIENPAPGIRPRLVPDCNAPDFRHVTPPCPVSVSSGTISITPRLSRQDRDIPRQAAAADDLVCLRGGIC